MPEPNEYLGIPPKHALSDGESKLIDSMLVEDGWCDIIAYRCAGLTRLTVRHVPFSVRGVEFPKTESAT